MIAVVLKGMLRAGVLIRISLTEAGSLTNFVRRARLGDSVAVEDETELMRSLVMQYSQWQRGQGGEDHGSSSQTSTTGTTVVSLL